MITILGKINVEDEYQEPNMNFVGTVPQVTPWNYLHPRGSNHSVMIVRLWIDTPLQATKNWLYEVNLEKYYDYCTSTNIDILGHTLDRVSTNQKCMISFYFASIEDKAHFILKYK